MAVRQQMGLFFQPLVIRVMMDEYGVLVEYME
jgi:hypothetical protein